MAAQLLSPAQVAALDDTLADWTFAGSQLDGTARLERTYGFANFVGAFGFMAAAALVAEKLNHHPTWTNTYGTVTVELSTHDSGGVTQLDVDLAARMDEIAATHAQPAS